MSNSELSFLNVKPELDFNNIVLEDGDYTISIVQNWKDGSINCQELAVFGPGAHEQDVFPFHSNDHLSFLNAYSNVMLRIKQLQEELVSQ